MSEIEFNKIFAAILIAGITFMLSGFLAGKLVKEEKLENPAYPIDGVEIADAGSTVKKVELPEPVLGLIADADVKTGEQLSRQCAACHSFDKGGPNKIGPNLWNVVNQPKGAVDGYNYSSALMETAGKWDFVALNKFLWRPDWYIEGTKMNYIGIKKPERRAAMIAWLRTLAEAPAPLPSEDEIAAERAELSPPEPEAQASAEEGTTDDGAAEETNTEEAAPSEEKEG